MHQVGKTPVDIQILNNSHCPIDRFLITELERGGNLKGYYRAQAHAHTVWVSDCHAITDTCELCRPVSGSSCLDRRTQGGHVGSFQRVDGDDQSGDFCSGNDDMGFEKESGGVTL
ncbi:hypothetical protein OIU78_005869 [Salix suchowensis]|nr:hypothetical protein OIU78_005869 [Salix suchowensis]